MTQRRVLVAVLVSGVGAFLALTALVLTGHIGGMDDPVRQWARVDGVGPLRTAARIVTDVLSPPVDAAVLVVAAAVTAHRSRRAAPVVVAATMIGVTAAAVLATKYGVGRRPPFLSAVAGDGRSFPSGHTAATLVFLATAVMLGARPGRRRQRLLTAVAGLTVLCAASLVYAGYHWLSDTLASVGVGAALLALLRLGEDVSRRTAPPPRRASRTRSRRS